MLGHESVDLSKVLIDGDVVKLVPREIARRYRMLAIRYDEAPRRLTVATSDPFDVIAMDQVRALFEPGVEVRPPARGRDGARQGESNSSTGTTCRSTAS